MLIPFPSIFISSKKHSCLCPQMRTLSEGDGLAEERRNVPWYHRVVNASALGAVARSLGFVIETPALHRTEPPNVRRNKKPLYPDRISDRSNASGMEKYHNIQRKDVVRPQGKVFNSLIKWFVLLYEPSLRAKLRSPNDSTPARTGGVLVIYEFVR